MDAFTRNLITEWRKLKLPVVDETFVIAVSGGADSTSLLLALSDLRMRKKLNLRFVVAHFNHDLRGKESDADEQFVKKLARDFEFELAYRKEKISGQGNLEQSARVARYEFLTETSENLRAFAVLTAHTLNDQAETFLLNLIRGSGLEGLGGMKTIRSLKPEIQGFDDNESAIRNPQSKILLIRPLLSWASREMTETFCRFSKIEFRNDSMNEDLIFKRVRVRKVLLPLLEDFNPKIVENLANTAFLLQKDFEVLKKVSAPENSINKENLESDNREEFLKLKELKNLFPSMRQQILREWIKIHRGDLRQLEKKHFEAIENLIFSRKSGRKIELPGEEFVLKEKGNLMFVKNKG